MKKEKKKKWPFGAIVENDWFTESYYQNFNDSQLKHKVLKIEIESRFSLS